MRLVLLQVPLGYQIGVLGRQPRLLVSAVVHLLEEFITAHQRPRGQSDLIAEALPGALPRRDLWNAIAPRTFAPAARDDAAGIRRHAGPGGRHMMDWINAHGSGLNFLANFGMLILWLIYMQVFLMTFIQGRKPRVLINRGAGSDLDSLILVSNMSQQPVYAQSVYCTIALDDRTVSTTVNDRDLLQKSGKGERPEGITSHGPLSRGEFMGLGTFRNVLEITVERSDALPGDLSSLSDRVRSVELMVVCAFGGDDLEIAARRRFRLDTSGDPWNVIPETPQTRQVSGRADRKRIRRMIQDELRQS